MIGKKEIYHPSVKDKIKDQLYKYSSNEYNEIFEDLIITGCHCILINEFESDEQRNKTIEIMNRVFITDDKYRLPACVDNKSIVYEIPGNYTIYHLSLENENEYWNYGIYANGLLVESISKRQLRELSDMISI
jgi:hypothetical protein